jgi:hypothetical protein
MTGPEPKPVDIPPPSRNHEIDEPNAPDLVPERDPDPAPVPDELPMPPDIVEVT